MRCRFNFRREGRCAIYEAHPGDTYADALLSFGIVPDTVLIFQAGKSLPEDAPIEEDEVDIVTTSSRG
ncbi:MAG TPA: thiamine S protein [Methanoculleus sp.]|nr:thiamine S protein [Methanoculleus sp.]